MFNQSKDHLWSMIHSSQDMIKTLQKQKPNAKHLGYKFDEVIRIEKALINKFYGDLKRLLKDERGGNL